MRFQLLSVTMIKKLKFLLFLSILSPACRSQPTPNESSANPYLLDLSPSFSVMFLLFIFTVLGCLVLIYLQYCCSLAVTDSPGHGSDGLSSAVIETYPIVAYIAVREHKIVKGARECAVCLAEFDDRDSIRLLPKCDHAFHPACIDPWLYSHTTCPVCRADLKPDRLAGKSADFRDRDNSAGGGNLGREQVAIGINEEETSRIAGVRVLVTKLQSGVEGKFPRSHSTGHSLAGDDRFTLTLPEEVRRQIMMTAARRPMLKRSASDDVVFCLS